jgi:hypothetical protein
MPKFAAKQDPFESLPEDFKDAVASEGAEAINKRISDIAKASADLDQAQSEDKDLAEKKAAVKEASAPYDKRSVKNGRRIAALNQVLQDNQFGPGTVADLNKAIGEAAKDEEENQKAKAEDEDLANKREEVKFATEPYRDGKKENRLRTLYCMRRLSDLGAA